MTATADPIPARGYLPDYKLMTEYVRKDYKGRPTDVAIIITGKDGQPHLRWARVKPQGLIVRWENKNYVLDDDPEILT